MSTTPAPGPFDFDDPNPNIDLTSIDLVHGFTHVKGNSDDSLIQLCITAASYEWIWQTGRGDEGQIVSVSPFVQPVPYDDILDGNGSFRQFVRNWPIVSVQSVTVNGIQVGPSTSYGMPGWLIDNSKKCLVMRAGVQQNRLGRAPRGAGFDEGIQNVEIQYTAGYSQVPPQVVKACTHMVAINYKRTAWLDTSSHSQGAQGASGTTTYRSWKIPPEVQKVMDDFTRNWTV